MVHIRLSLTGRSPAKESDARVLFAQLSTPLGWHHLRKTDCKGMEVMGLAHNSPSTSLLHWQGTAT
jgi:hypothetical protein